MECRHKMSSADRAHFLRIKAACYNAKMKTVRKAAAKSARNRKSPAGKAVRQERRAPASRGVSEIRNRLFIGDNLPIMTDIFAEHGACADLIYLDPPFNSKTDYNFIGGPQRSTTALQTSFRDAWKFIGTNAEKDFADFTAEADENGNRKPETPAARYMRAARNFLGTSGDGGSMLAYLTHMVPRLEMMRRLLKPTGSIYLHCDQTASHYLKTAMDAVFGMRNFRNNLVWHYENASRGKKQWAKSHDDLLWYAMNGKGVFNRDKVLAAYKSGMTEWRYKQKGKKPPAGKTPDDVIDFAALHTMDHDVAKIPALNTMDKKERMGYPTQKPLALLRKIVLASSNPGDLVMDPYCGCGTTIAACRELAANGGGRDFVGIDQEGFAAQVMRRRMEKAFGYDLRLAYNRPGTVEEFDALAENKAWLYYEFFAVQLIPGAMPSTTVTKERLGNLSRMGDAGMDGILPVKHEGGRKDIIISVKAGGNLTPGMMQQLRGVVSGDPDALGGILVTRHKPSAQSNIWAQAENGGMFRRKGEDYPRFQIVTVAELMEDARLRENRRPARNLRLPTGLVDFTRAAKGTQGKVF